MSDRAPRRATPGTKLTAVVHFCLPETLGRSSAAIDELFERGVPLRKFAETPTKVEGTWTEETV